MPARPLRPFGRREPRKERKPFEQLTEKSVRSEGRRLHRLVGGAFHWGRDYKSTVPVMRNRGNTTINLNTSPDAIYVKDRGRVLGKLIPSLAREVRRGPYSLSAKGLKCMRCNYYEREPRSPYCASCNNRGAAEQPTKKSLLEMVQAKIESDKKKGIRYPDDGDN